MPSWVVATSGDVCLVFAARMRLMCPLQRSRQWGQAAPESKMMAARLAGPLPVRLVAVSSANVTSRTSVVVRLDGPVLADEPGQILRVGVSAGQAGDGVDALAGDLAGSGVLPPAGDLDGLAGVLEVQAADVGGLQGPGLYAAMPCLADRSARPVACWASPACARRRSAGRGVIRSPRSGWLMTCTGRYRKRARRRSAELAWRGCRSAIVLYLRP